MEILKLINFQMVLAQTICFLLVLFLLKKFLWKPVFAVLEERKTRIQDELKSISDAKADVLKLKKEYSDSLLAIDETARLKVRAGEQLGEAHARDIKEKARLDADRIIEDSRKEIRFEINKAREALRTDVVGMVITATEQMIQEKLSFDSDKKIIEGMLKEMDKVDA
jgi:F-type H+-transporting ATPase subunit b